ncbi:hypothetical protein B0H14DRAFT_2556193 [Mycena olivaceomarginata]|nr:hypothetical protein B0H14DRAFT_2556193 [Mycena olivaceomarginata]
MCGHRLGGKGVQKPNGLALNGGNAEAKWRTRNGMEGSTRGQNGCSQIGGGGGGRRKWSSDFFLPQRIGFRSGRNESSGPTMSLFRRKDRSDRGFRAIFLYSMHITSRYLPIRNTGNIGPILHQPGDWICLKCNYLNWRRRKVCQTYLPYAECNGARVSPRIIFKILL